MTTPSQTSPSEVRCFATALRLLREGQRSRALVLVMHLLDSDIGRPLALRLLAQMYADAPALRAGTERAPDGARPSGPHDRGTSGRPPRFVEAVRFFTDSGLASP
jgi:hypothetical protein